MSYEERPDGRDFNEIREMTAKAGVIENADGSAFFTTGKTEAYAAVHGPRELHPKHLQNPKKGVLRCYYTLLPFGGVGDRVRPGHSRRGKEISKVMEESLRPVVDLSEFPNTAVDVFVDLPQTDAGSRCAAISAASIALADAGIPMKQLVSAIAVGRVDDKLVVDLDYKEEAYEDGPVADIPVAMTSNTQDITLLQMDGEISKEQLMETMQMAKEATAKIDEVQRKAIKQKFNDHEV